MHSKNLLLLIMLACSSFMSGQTTTTMTDIGKVGNLHFSFAKSDTANAVSIMQNSPIGSRLVMFADTEIPEVVKMLNAFAEQTAKKPGGQTVTQYNTKSLLLSCSYFKDGTWLILVQNTIPVLDQTSEEIQRKTGIQVYHFVEIKPRQLDEVVKIFSKVLPPKPV